MNPTKEILVGRFALSLPMAMRRVGQEHMVRGSVHMREVEWTASHTYESAWSARLRELSERRLPPGVRTAIIDQHVIAPKCRGVLMHDSEYDRNILTWYALLDTGTHGVWLECRQEPRADKQALSRLSAVARSYVVLSAQSRQHPESWFYLERGAVTLPTLERERVIVQFDGFPLDLKMEVCIRSALVSDPHGGLKERFERALALGYQGDMKVELLKHGPRMVAGVIGEELIAQIEDEGDLLMAWGWLGLGRAGDPRAPRIELLMNSTAHVQEDKTRIWDVALSSMLSLL